MGLKRVSNGLKKAFLLKAKMEKSPWCRNRLTGQEKELLSGIKIGLF